MQIKTSMKYHSTLNIMAMIKKIYKEYMLERESSHSVGENVHCTVTMENSMEVPEKTKNKATI